MWDAMRKVFVSETEPRDDAADTDESSSPLGNAGLSTEFDSAPAAPLQHRREDRTDAEPPLAHRVTRDPIDDPVAEDVAPSNNEVTTSDVSSSGASSYTIDPATLELGSLVGERYRLTRILGHDVRHGSVVVAIDTATPLACRSCGLAADRSGEAHCPTCGASYPDVVLGAGPAQGDGPDDDAALLVTHIRERRPFGSLGVSLRTGGWSAEGPHHPNEDSFWAQHRLFTANSQRRSVAVVLLSDGMGGYAPGSGLISGHIAAQAGAAIASALEGPDLDESAIEGLVRGALAKTNAMVLDAVARLGDMGATVVIVVVIDDVAFIANIGDSRVYHVDHHGAAKLVTMDQSLIAQELREGIIRDTDVYTAPGNNIILHAVGEPGVESAADWYVEPLERGSRLILCTDGYWKTMHGEVPHDIGGWERSADDIARQLVEEALAQGSDDNTTVVVVDAQ